MKQQVLVIGAGPIGMTMAAELARYGVPTRIIEKAAQRTDKSKALVVWSRTMELINRMGYSARFVEAGLKGHHRLFASDNCRSLMLDRRRSRSDDELIRH